MSTTSEAFELPFAALDEISGGQKGTGCGVFNCHTGDIQFGNDHGGWVQWPGKSGDTNGVYTLSASGGLTWFPSSSPP